MEPEGPKYSPISSMKQQEKGGWESGTPIASIGEACGPRLNAH